jgi:hypothetical protein
MKAERFFLKDLHHRLAGEIDRVAERIQSLELAIKAEKPPKCHRG